MATQFHLMALSIGRQALTDVKYHITIHVPKETSDCDQVCAAVYQRPKSLCSRIMYTLRCSNFYRNITSTPSLK